MPPATSCRFIYSSAGFPANRLLSKVSKLYYENDHTQQEIADTLHLSRQKVSRLPAQAREEAISSDRYVQYALYQFDHLDTAYVGIGALETNAALNQERSLISQDEFDELVARGAVGDMAMRFFDADCRRVESSLYDRMIGITLDQLKRVDRVVGVAGGVQKRDVILGALRGGLVDVLITDHRTAAALLVEERASVSEW